MCKTDELTYERAIEVLRYDPESGVLERKLPSGEWRVCGHRPTCLGYGYVKVAGKRYLSHRLIWLLVNGAWPAHDIDHIDRDKMNNRLENLRAVTRTENQHNHGIHSDNASGYLGVSFQQSRNKFRADIRLNNRNIYLGLYPTAEEAFLAYMHAKIKYHPSSPAAQEYLRELALSFQER